MHPVQQNYLDLKKEHEVAEKAFYTALSDTENYTSDEAAEYLRKFDEAYSRLYFATTELCKWSGEENKWLSLPEQERESYIESLLQKG